MGFPSLFKAWTVAQPALRGNFNSSTDDSGSVITWINSFAPAFQPYANAGSHCVPLWAESYKTCPYGTKLIGDVTLPDYERAKNWGATLPPDSELPTKETLLIAVCYSYFPYIMGLFGLLLFLIHRGTAEFHFLVFLGFLVFTNEIILKKLFAHRRPMLSCLTSCGMPSGHAVLAVGTLIQFIMQGFLTVRPRKSSRILLQSSADKLAKDYHLSSIGVVKAIVCLVRRFFSDSLREYFDEPSEYEIVHRAVLWTLFIAPVPLSRVQLSDHTPWQVFVGTIVGTLLSGGWIYVIRRVQRSSNRKLGKGKFFQHNYAIPCQSFIQQIEKDIDHRSQLLAPVPDGATAREAIDNRSDTGNSNGFPAQAYLYQINWYALQTLKRHVAFGDAIDADEDSFLKLRWYNLQLIRAKLIDYIYSNKEKFDEKLITSLEQEEKDRTEKKKGGRQWPLTTIQVGFTEHSDSAAIFAYHKERTFHSIAGIVDGLHKKWCLMVQESETTKNEAIVKAAEEINDKKDDLNKIKEEISEEIRNLNEMIKKNEEEKQKQIEELQNHAKKDNANYAEIVRLIGEARNKATEAGKTAQGHQTDIAEKFDKLFEESKARLNEAKNFQTEFEKKIDTFKDIMTKASALASKAKEVNKTE